MAANYPDDDHDAWEGDVLEDPERGAEFDHLLARRAGFLQHRLQNNDWCTCNGCWPVFHAESDFDVKCCQEYEQVQQVCQENALFRDENPYACIVSHGSFYSLCLYERYLLSIENDYHMEGVDLRRIHRNERMRYIAYRSFTR